MPSVSTNIDYSEMNKKQEVVIEQPKLDESKIEHPKQDDIKQDTKKNKSE
jgi:hypothetical protein